MTRITEADCLTLPVGVLARAGRRVASACVVAPESCAASRQFAAALLAALECRTMFRNRHEAALWREFYDEQVRALAAPLARAGLLEIPEEGE